MTTTLPQLTTDLYIDGTFQSGSAAPINDLNPTDESHLVTVAAADATDIDAAVRSSREAFTGAWGALSGAARGALLNRLADLFERDAEALATLEAVDIGKPIGQPRMIDVPNAIATLRYYAGWADKVTGSTIPNPGHVGRPTHSYTIREPLGVVGAIVPWNSPLMLGTWKIAAALASGNTVVIKPPELAPLSLLYVARLVDEAGFPPGTLNVVPGLGSVAGEALVAHPDVAKIAFTGSTDTGRHIGKLAAGTFKRTTLELGGKSPQIILADADLETAIMNSAIGLFAVQGEVCVAGTRVLVHHSLYDQVVDGLAQAARAQVVGDPLDPATTIGPLISARQRDIVERYIHTGLEEGAQMAAGGAYDGAGFFVNPTIFAGANNDMTIAREEIFGPVGTVIPFEDPVDAVRIANANQYGLAATIWTRDVSHAHSLAGQIQAGIVWVNGWGISHPSLPWGGIKGSGVGQELGWNGIVANTSEKVVTVVL